MVRFENLQDFFDKKNPNSINQIDIKKFANKFYSDANSGSAPSSLKIEEYSLSANQPKSEISKFRWMGEDDSVQLQKEINQPSQDKGNFKSLEA